MKTLKLTLITALLAVSVLGSAQNYAFKVLANKGTNEVKSGETWQPLKTGSSLQSSDEVKLGDNAYLGLVHSTGKPVEVKQSGVYKVSELASKVAAGTSVLNKYTDFILSSNSAEAKKNRLSATGAVHRGVLADIKVMFPEKNQSSGIYNNLAVLNWDGTHVSGPYVVTLKNMFEDVLSKEETPETTYKIDLSNAKYANENAILIEINSKADPKMISNQYIIKKLSPAERENVKKAFSELPAEVSEETPFNKFILAGFYEKNNLLIDAIAAYQEAIAMAPDVPTYQENYEEFLLRNGLK
jgi:hypothetical protein